MSGFAAVLIALAAMLVLAMLLCITLPRAAPWIGAASAGASALVLALSSLSGAPAELDVPWLGSTGSRLVLELDGLAALMGTFTAALAALVLGYTSAYLPHHLASQGRGIEAQGRFCAQLLAFMAAMLLLVMAQDLLILFVALELTALLSFLLIQFDRESDKARGAAMSALVVTATGALPFLIGLLLVAAEHGTTVLSELDGAALVAMPVAALCLIAGTLAKSAQMPLHFWLPRAMVAPTPVSAYLHSAALVAAGVFVLMRLRPWLDAVQIGLDLMVWLGLVSAIVGGLLAFAADGFKRILAYSTIAQYGHVLVLIGLGGEHGLVGAPLFVVVHGCCKAALFLTAGAVTQTTGAERLSEASSSWREMPWLALASALAAAGLVGLPATAGYFKEELFFAAAGHGPGLAAGALIAATLTVAYAARFWLGLFRPRATAKARAASAGPVAPALWLPVAVLAAVVVGGGIAVAALGAVIEPAVLQLAESPPPVELAYALRPSVELGLALGALTAGAILIGAAARVVPALAAAARRIGFLLGPSALAARAAQVVGRLSNRLHELEVRDLRDRIAIVLIPAAAIVALSIVAGQRLAAPLGDLSWHDAPLIAALAATALAALVVARANAHLDVVLLLSFVGFGLAIVFSIGEALEIALLVVIVETLFTLLFVGLLGQLGGNREPAPLARAATAAPPAPDRSAWAPKAPRGGRGHGVWTAAAAGTAAFATAWFALGAHHTGITARAYSEYTEAAHATDTVSAIVADFRALDTLVEVTVLTVAVLGAISLGREPRT